MKKKTLAHIATGFMLAVVLMVVVVGIVKIRPLLMNFESVEIATIAHAAGDDTETAGQLFDRVLLDKLQHFEYIKSFNHLFTGQRQTRQLPSLSVDRCEVSQGEFKKFSQWIKKNEKAHMLAPGQPYGWKFYSNTEKHLISGRLEAPANGVSYYDAYAYCRAAGGRLPYSDEWVALAGGADGKRLYP